jgi:hypothetical protein
MPCPPRWPRRNIRRHRDAESFFERMHGIAKRVRAAAILALDAGSRAANEFEIEMPECLRHRLRVAMQRQHDFDGYSRSRHHRQQHELAVPHCHDERMVRCEDRHMLVIERRRRRRRIGERDEPRE